MRLSVRSYRTFGVQVLYKKCFVCLCIEGRGLMQCFPIEYEEGKFYKGTLYIEDTSE